MNGDERPTRAISGQLVETIAGELEQSGLNMFAVLDRRIVDDCALSDRALNDPDAYSSTPRNHAVSDAVCDSARGDVASDDTTPSSEIRSVALIGNSGRRLWNCLPDVTGQEHLVDDYSCREVSRVLTKYLGETGWAILYPDRSGNTVPPLQYLGGRAGWHHPSPLGSGIHPQHGLWFAYRAVVVFAFELPESRLSVLHTADTNNGNASGASPCVSCIDQPCIRSCPASALGIDRAPDLNACAGFRSAEQSPCAERCLARESCPVGVQSRYVDEQINYHYRQSLESLRRWVAETGSEQ